MAVVSSAEKAPDQLDHRLAVLLVIAAFGPYLVGSIRTEQVAVYAVTPLVLMRFAGRGRISAGLLVLALLWATILGVSTVSGFSPPPLAVNVSPLSGIDALLAPLCLMLIVIIWAGRNGAESHELLTVVQKATVVLLAGNAVLELVMTTTTSVTPFLSAHWWSGVQLLDGRRTVGLAAAQNGRFGGVFNSPLAAGTAYSVGAVALCHLYLRREWVGRRAGLCMVLLLVGGVIPQSKTFLFAGLPIALLLVAVVAGVRRPNALIGFAATAAVSAFVVSQTTWWAEFGHARLSRFFVASSDPLQLFTAGRYGQVSSVRGIRDDVLHSAPFGGYGAGVNLGALDTSWTEMLARAGLLGLVAFLLWLALSLALILNRRREVTKAQWWTSIAMWLVLLAAAAGGPSLTQNRAGTLLTLNLMLLLATRLPSPRDDDAEPARASTASARR